MKKLEVKQTPLDVLNRELENFVESYSAFVLVVEGVCLTLPHGEKLSEFSEDLSTDLSALSAAITAVVKNIDIRIPSQAERRKMVRLQRALKKSEVGTGGGEGTTGGGSGGTEHPDDNPPNPPGGGSGENPDT